MLREKKKKSRKLPLLKRFVIFVFHNHLFLFSKAFYRVCVLQKRVCIRVCKYVLRLSNFKADNRPVKPVSRFAETNECFIIVHCTLYPSTVAYEITCTYLKGYRWWSWKMHTHCRLRYLRVNVCTSFCITL